MNREKLFTFLWASILAFLLSMGAVASLVTAFDMEVDLVVLAIWCAVGAVGSSICFSLPLGLVPISTLSLVSGLIWRRGSLCASLESLLYRITNQYHKGYKWGAIQLNDLPPEEMEAILWIGLSVIGIVIAMLISWSVCRRKTALPGAILSVILLGSCMVVTDTVPDAPWLCFLFFALVMLLLTNTVRRQDPARGNRLSGVLLLPMVFILLGLFVLIPEKGYTGDELPRKMMDELKKNERVAQFFGETVEVGTSGSSVDSGVVNLRTVGIRLPSQAEVMQVLTDYDDTLYLRGRALDRYDGLTWTDSGISTANLYWPDSPRLGETGEVMITTRYAHRMLYLPYYVQSKNLTDMTRGLENTNKLSQYSFTCQVLDKNNDYYKIYTDAYYDEGEWEQEFAHYLHLSDEVWAWAEPLALQITAGKESIYDKAQAICNYVRSSATYDTNTRRMPSEATDFAKWFLEQSETGYCVHFATATTVLLQAAGIPARYVTGYMVDVEAAYVEIVQSKDAHAWAEYWLPGYGWMVLESTPPDLRGEAQPTEATTPVQVQTPEETYGESNLGFQTARPSNSDKTNPNKQNNTASTDPVAETQGSGWLIRLALILVGALGLLLSQWRLRLHRRKKALTRGSTNQQVLAYWQELDRCHSRLPEPPAEKIRDLAEKAKFSPHTLSSSEVAQMAAALAQAREKLAEKSVLKRLWDRLIWALY